ncbi:MAG: type 1 glutamine amidotransferase [Deltaproteobacteria bacterium]|nr:type 1 glutamine amidotransferase [Deltaproteobacteria bacterium]
MNQPILVLQHLEGEGLGTIKNTLRIKGIKPVSIKIFAGERIPEDTSGYSGLIILGGTMGVYEDDIHPFIRDEIALIRKALKDGLPILGICLGAQMLAKAAGGEVYKGGKKEIGWYKVGLTPEAKRDRLFMDLPEELTVFQWHGDTFDIPAGGVRLAYSNVYPNQAMRVGERAYGLQFHLEITEGMIKDWLKDYERELATTEIDPERILEGTPENIQTLNGLGRVVFSRFLDITPHFFKKGEQG